MKKLFLLVSVLVLAVALTGCKKESWEGIDSEISGEIDIMLWSGSGTFYEDMGSMDLDVEDLVAQNDAAVYYIIKEFNKIYPNVKVNLLAHTGGPEDGGRIWSQALKDYETDYTRHPGIWATTDLAGDISKGIVADLSQFSDDPVYKLFNPSIMDMMNYYGFQGGLPQYILPWGIYVNKELAEDKNLDVPNYDWDIDEYTDFIGNSEESVYYGSMDTPIHIIETGVSTLHKQLFEYRSGDEFVDLESQEVKDLIAYLEEWNEHSVWGGAQEQTFMDDHWWWSYKFFIENKLLTLEGDPWMMGDCATPLDADPDKAWWGSCKSQDWDIYPRPSTDYADNTVGIVLDPMAVYNYCLEDGNLECTEEENLKIKVAYTLASFWTADSRSWTARAEGEFTDVENGVTSSSLNDSFPVVTGDLFDEQMEIWYTPLKHQRFRDESLMPGFHEIIRIYELGQFWDVSDKSFPYFHTVEGTRRENLYEFKNYWNPDINGGVEKGDANFTETVLGKLPEWNELTNERFATSFANLRKGLKDYYGYTDADFE